MIKTPKAPNQLIIDDGTREIPLVNKFGKLICNIYIRPADYSIVDRYNKLMKDFENIIKPLSDVSLNHDGTANFDDGWEILKSVENEVKRRFDELFDMEEADDIFAKRNAFSSIGGEFYCAKVLLALGGYIADAISEESAKSQKRVAKYLTPETENTDAGAAANVD